MIFFQNKCFKRETKLNSKVPYKTILKLVMYNYIFQTNLKLFLPSNSENMYAKWRLETEILGQSL